MRNRLAFENFMFLDLPELACSDMDLSSRCRRRRDSAIGKF